MLNSIRESVLYILSEFIIRVMHYKYYNLVLGKIPSCSVYYTVYIIVYYILYAIYYILYVIYYIC